MTSGCGGFIDEVPLTYFILDRTPLHSMVGVSVSRVDGTMVTSDDDYQRQYNHTLCVLGPMSQTLTLESVCTSGTQEPALDQTILI